MSNADKIGRRARRCPERVLRAFTLGTASAAALLFISARAWLLPFTIDECGSWLEQVPLSYGDLLTYSYPVGNHHLLNSFLMKVMDTCMGASAIALRLPNVVAGFAYVLGVVALGRRLRHVGAVAMLAGLLILNVYVLEFFGLARGYGLALAMQLWALVFARDWYVDGKLRQLVGAVCLGGLSVAASFAWVPFLIGLSVVLSGIVALRVLARESDLEGNRPMCLLRFGVVTVGIPVLSLAIMAPLMLRVAASMDSLVGGTEGLLGATARSLVFNYLYYWNPLGLQGVLFYGLLTGTIVLAVVAVFWGVRSALSRKGSLGGALLIVSGPTLGVALGAVWAMTQFASAKYPVGRTGLYLMLLWSISVVGLVDVVASRFRRLVNVAGTGVLLFCALHFCGVANMSRAREYVMGIDTRQVIEMIRSDAGSSGGNVTVGINELLGPECRYHSQVPARAGVLHFVPYHSSRSQNYRYLLVELDVEAVEDPAYEVIKRFPVSGSVLMKRRESISQEESM